MALFSTALGVEGFRVLGDHVLAAGGIIAAGALHVGLEVIRKGEWFITFKASIRVKVRNVNLEFMPFEGGRQSHWWGWTQGM